MSLPLTPALEDRLTKGQTAWLGTVRPDGRPHVTPIWFVWDGVNAGVATQPRNQKVGNIEYEPRVNLALDDSTRPVSLEACGSVVVDFPQHVLEGFAEQHGWNLKGGGANTSLPSVNVLLRLEPSRWLMADA